MPAVPFAFIEPVWQQFVAILPPRQVSHLLGCHWARIPDRTVFDKLVQDLGFGCAYHRIANEAVSVTMLSRRWDEWIAASVIIALLELVMIGLALGDRRVD